eukprot:1915861-Amphidinium_carterae.1
MQHCCKWAHKAAVCRSGGKGAGKKGVSAVLDGTEATADSTEGQGVVAATRYIRSRTERLNNYSLSTQS